MDRETQINFQVILDENHVPTRIAWKATDGDQGGLCDSIMLNLWDSNDKQSMRIDLWTKEMTVDDMKQFCHQTLLTMSDTLVRSTGEEEAAHMMRQFAFDFAKKLEILPEEFNGEVE